MCVCVCVYVCVCVCVYVCVCVCVCVVSGPPEAAPDLELLALAAENRKLQEELLRQQSHVQQLQQAYAVRILQNEALRKQIAEQTRREAKQRRGFKQLRKT